MPATLEKPTIFGTRLAAGTAVAEVQPDGSVLVDNLPIFSEIRETDPGVAEGARIARGKDWLDRAVVKAAERASLGKHSIMTLRHYMDSPQRVGTWMPKRVDLAEVNPDEPPRWTVFGAKRYADINSFEVAKDYDFRSVEISPDAPDEFGALALLRDKEPFHKYPGLTERLAPELREAFQAEAFRSRVGAEIQPWKGRVETFGADSPYAVANAMLKRGEITKAKFDDVVAAIKRSEHAAYESKEGVKPMADEKDKAPSIEEKMEAMVNRCFENFMKKFEERMGGLAGGDKNPGDGDKTEKAEDKNPAEEPKKPEANQTTGPNAMLPPAVSQQRPGEDHGARNGHGATITEAEKVELFGLRAFVQKKQKEEEIESFAAAGEKALRDGGVTVDDTLRALVREKSKEGKGSVEGTVAGILHFAKGASRQPEPFGAMSQFGGVAQPGMPEDLKKAIDTFGQRPEVKARIIELYSDGWRQMPEHFRRNISGGFLEVCQGSPDINPACMEARGGLQRKA